MKWLRIKGLLFCLPKLAVWICTVLLFCSSVKGTAALPSILYGTIGEGRSSTNNVLVIIDQNTGAVAQTIGPIGYSINGLAFDPTTGILYATTSIFDANHVGLLTIDVNTGAGTPVGTPWTGNALVCLACNASGQLFAWSETGQDDLVLIDKVTANFTVVGDSGISTAEEGMDFDSSGTLWFLNVGIDVDTINTTTGLATFVTNVSPTTLGHHGKFNPQNGQFWGIDQAINQNPRNIAIFDLANGTVLNLLPTVDDLHTLAFTLNLAPEPVGSVVGKQKSNRFAAQSECYNKIQWTKSPSQDVVSYRIYSGAVLIASLPSSQLSFEDHVCCNRTKEYSITAVNSNGIESDPVTIIIK